MPYYQEAVNERIGSLVCERLSIPHIAYSVAKQEEQMYSICECGITKEEDLVLLYDLSNYIDAYNPLHAVEQCKKFLKQNHVEEYFDDMIIADYLLRNTDRHLRNAAVVYSAKDNTVVKAFPVFDFGNSLWHNVPTEWIDNRPVKNMLTGRLYEDDLRMLRHVSVSLSRLDEVPDIVHDCLMEYDYTVNRADQIAKTVKDRVQVARRLCGMSRIPQGCMEVTDDCDFDR